MWKKRSDIYDDNLIAALSKGDEEAFGVLFSRYSAALRNFVTGMTKDKAASEDIVQNIFMRILLTHPQFDSLSAFKNWLYLCARNETLNYLKSKWQSGVERLSDVPQQIAADAGLEQDAVANRTSQLNSILDSMPEKRSRVFRMSKMQGMSNSEIANKMGISERTVEKHIQLAYRELRSRSS